MLRHPGASAMVAAGISLRVVQVIGAWSTLRMLERYAHPSGAEKSRAVRVLSAYTTGTKTGTVAKNRNGDPERSDASRAVKSEVRKWRPQRDSNPCFGLERATSWASGRWGRAARRAEHLMLAVEGGFAKR
jgi:integrase-like protein